MRNIVAESHTWFPVCNDSLRVTMVTGAEKTQAFSHF